MPPSLRAFYRCHDGATLAGYRIATLEGLVADTLRARVDDLTTYGENVDSLLALIDQGDADRYVLDASQADDSGEFPVLDAYHDAAPSVWRTMVIAPSFASWLRGVFRQVLDRGVIPGTEIALEDGSASAEHYHRLGVRRAAEGQTDLARTRFLEAIALRDLETAPFAHDVACLLALGSRDAGDAFLNRLLVRVVEAKRAAEARKMVFVFGASLGDRRSTLKDVEVRLGTRIPPELSSIISVFWSVGFSLRPKAAPAEATVTFFGSSDHYLRRADTSIKGAPPDAVIIGQVETFDRLSIDSIVSEGHPPHRIICVPFRRDPSYQSVNAPFAETPLRQGEPTVVAANLDEYIDRVFSAYDRNESPFVR